MADPSVPIHSLTSSSNSPPAAFHSLIHVGRVTDEDHNEQSDMATVMYTPGTEGSGDSRASPRINTTNSSMEAKREDSNGASRKSINTSLSDSSPQTPITRTSESNSSSFALTSIAATTESKTLYEKLHVAKRALVSSSSDSTRMVSCHFKSYVHTCGHVEVVYVAPNYPEVSHSPSCSRHSRKVSSDICPSLISEPRHIFVDTTCTKCTLRVSSTPAVLATQSSLGGDVDHKKPIWKPSENILTPNPYRRNIPRQHLATGQGINDDQNTDYFGDSISNLIARVNPAGEVHRADNSRLVKLAEASTTIIKENNSAAHSPSERCVPNYKTPQEDNVSHAHKATKSAGSDSPDPVSDRIQALFLRVKLAGEVQKIDDAESIRIAETITPLVDEDIKIVVPFQNTKTTSGHGNYREDDLISQWREERKNQDLLLNRYAEISEELRVAATANEAYMERVRLLEIRLQRTRML